MKYQLQFKTGGSGKSRSYRYVEGNKKTAPDLAIKEAMIELEKGYNNQNIFHQFNPQKTIQVVELEDKGENHKPFRWITKKGGHKFKIRLCHMTMTFHGGNKKKEMWYEAEEPVTK